MKLLLTESSSLCFDNDISLDDFKSFGEVVFLENPTRENILSCGDFDIILCNKAIIDRFIMQSMPSLKYVGVFATGYNNIDINAANDLNITVCNAGNYSTSAVAQQVFAYILAHYNRVDSYDKLVKNGEWIKSPTFSMPVLPTDELLGKTIGIIGYGNIGRRVAQIAKAFEMNVIIFNRTVYPDISETFVSFDKLLKNSDIITVHCPLNSESEGMFDSEAFNKIKPGAFFINTSRGGVVDEKALYDALENGRLSGAAVDVLSSEPMKADCILKDAKNIIITPHIAWAPVATRKRLVKTTVDNIRCYLSGHTQNKVN